MVRITYPPPAVMPQPIFHTIDVGTRLVRIFNPTGNWPMGSVEFNHYGPRSRFDHHAPLPPGVPPQLDPDHAIYYAAWTLSCCIAEYFGDEHRIDKPHLHIAYPTVTRPLRLLDLCDNGAMRIGSVAALCMTADRAITQAWSRFCYTDPVFAGCDGIRFHSAHNNEPAVALYERAETALDCAADHTIALSDPLLRSEIERIALEQGLQMLI